MRLILGVLILGCSANRPLYLPEPEIPTPTPSSMPDFSSLADLARPPPSDLGGFCGGTGIAGTCLQSFFARLYDCFQPAGSCISNGAVVAPPRYCWSNGAKLMAADTAGATGGWLYWSASGTLCATWHYKNGNPGDDDRASDFVDSDSKVYYAPETGVYSCDNYTIVDSVGPDCGGCGELCALFKPPTGCSVGDCF